VKVIGQYSASGEFCAYTAPLEVFRFGDTLRDADGLLVAVIDEYGDWVSASMRRIALKSRMEIVE